MPTGFSYTGTRGSNRFSQAPDSFCFDSMVKARLSQPHQPNPTRGKHVGKHLPKLGSLGHPFSFTPRELVSMRKCLTSSLVKSPGKRQDVLTPEPPSSYCYAAPLRNQCSSSREGSPTLHTPSSNLSLCTGSTPSQAPPQRWRAGEAVPTSLYRSPSCKCS